jgi:predicted Fe-S protein YdhL (DUF1289 family)
LQATPSPCIGICRMNDATGLCDGCLRTLDEIAAWSTLDDDAKRAVWDAIDARHTQWMARRFDGARASTSTSGHPGDTQ